VLADEVDWEARLCAVEDGIWIGDDSWRGKPGGTYSSRPSEYHLPWPDIVICSVALDLDRATSSLNSGVQEPVARTGEDKGDFYEAVLRRQHQTDVQKKILGLKLFD